jgi:hypothetical protein
MILNSIVPVFFVMAIGYLAGWTRDIDNHHVAELNALVMEFALPASLFVAMVQTPRAQSAAAELSHGRARSIERGNEGGIQLFPDGVTSLSGHTHAKISATPIPMDTSANR